METAKLLLEFVGVMAVIMGLIMLVAVLTPKIARLIDKNRKASSPERVDEVSPEEYTVGDPYGKQELEDYDLNYKIYNTDIYGWEALGVSKKKHKKSGENDNDGNEKDEMKSERNVDNGKE